MKPLQYFWFANLLVGSLILLALSIGWTDFAIAEDTSDSDAASTPESAAIQRGAAIYQSLCTECHGDAGQGVEGMYDDPLLGDATVGELADLISETMPEGDPDACVAEDAVAVANFIHQAFYSEAARTRNRPPRVDLSRLTAEQLRQSLADLYGRLSGSGDRKPVGQTEHGLRASIYADDRERKENLAIERVDPQLNFDFGHQGPGEGVEPEEFLILWTGGLKIKHTGRYEFVVRSSCAFTMDFGGSGRELINNHVQSEGKEEFRQVMNLTAGRSYPLRIRFVQRKRKTEQPPAKFSFSWVPPGGVEEIVPAVALVPETPPSTFALQTKLPPDDSSYGYSRGTSVNRAWDEATTAAALEFADMASDELYPQYHRRHRKKGESSEGQSRSVLRAFLNELVQAAFRRPLDEPLRKLYIDRQVETCPDDAEAIKKVSLIALKSPRFLYPLLDSDRSDSQRVANRLALTLWDSLPSDEWLVQAAEQGQLENEEQIREAARRMVQDQRCEAKLRAMLYHWFDLKSDQQLHKDQERYPGFDAALVSQLRRSFDLFLDRVLHSERSDLRELLQADWSFTSERLADFYGAAWKPADPAGQSQSADSDHSASSAVALVPSVSDAQQHVGVLTHPLLMSELAYHRTTSPIHRGVFLTRHLLGRVLRPPNAAFTPIDPDLHPGLTTRQRVELQTGEVNCQVCHAKINGLGFALEGFDAAGRFRLEENEQPIDASGQYTTLAGQRVTFTGARELGDFLAGHEDCHRAFVEAAFEHFVKQPVAAFGADQADRLTESFQDSGFNIRELIVSIATVAAQPPTTGELQ